MADWIIDLPLIGRCNLVPQVPGSTPERSVALAYLELEGAPDRLVAGFWEGGRWRDHRDKALPAPVFRWFEVVDKTGKVLL